jgi:hypothetical protein
MTHLLTKKLKMHICYLIYLKNLTIINVKLKRPLNVFGLEYIILVCHFELYIFSQRAIPEILNALVKIVNLLPHFFT